MVKVLEVEGHLTNAEVLQFIASKRLQHTREDGEDSNDGKENDRSRPQRFMKSLAKHERHLIPDSYPYTKNPSAYGSQLEKTHQQLLDLHMERIQKPIFESYMARALAKESTGAELKAQMQAELDRKELTETEWLMIANHAPTTTEMLHPMIEQCDERYTQEELGVLVQAIKDTYRKDEYGMGG
jgi:hypothetical protein